jgi:hypothetical protein
VKMETYTSRTIVVVVVAFTSMGTLVTVSAFALTKRRSEPMPCWRGGFAAEDQGAQAFSYQADRAQEAHPEIIVIMGGLADRGFAGKASVGVGAVDAINKIKLGGGRALVIAPMWYGTTIRMSVTSVSDEIHVVAQGAGVPYFNALHPPWLTTDQMQPEISSPTDEGQSAIADRVPARLRTEVAG